MPPTQQLLRLLSGPHGFRGAIPKKVLQISTIINVCGRIILSLYGIWTALTDRLALQVKVWFQNRRTKYKRAKADDEHDESSTVSAVSDRRREQTTHDEDDNENDAKKSATGVEDVLDCSEAAPASSDQLTRSPTPPSAVCRHNADDRLPPCNGDDFRSPLLLSRQTVSGCQDSDRKHSSNGASTTSRRNKTSHHVNRWRAETNQLWNAQQDAVGVETASPSVRDIRPWPTLWLILSALILSQSLFGELKMYRPIMLIRIICLFV